MDAMVFVAVALIAQVGIDRWTQAPHSAGLDYFTLWAVGRCAQALPHVPIYDANGQRQLADRARVEARVGGPTVQRVMAVSDEIYGRRLDATGSPFAYAVAGVTSTGSYDRDLQRFTLAGFAAFVLSMWWMCRLLQYSPLGMAVAFVTFGFCFAPVLADVRVANLNQILLGAIALYLWLLHAGRPVLAGAVMGLSIALKPVTILVVLVSVAVRLIDRRPLFRDHLLTGVVAGVLTGGVVAVLYFGRPSIWVDFVRSVPRTLDGGYPLAHGNFSLAALLAGVTSPTWAAIVGVAAVALVVVMLVHTRHRTGTAAGDADARFLEAGIGACLVLLTSGLVWVHYYVLLIPLCLYLLRPQVGPRQRWLMAASGAAVSSLFLFSPGVHMALTSPMHSAVLTNTATVLLFVAAVVSWMHRRRADRLREVLS